MTANAERLRIGLNALLYSEARSYRAAGVSHYIGGLLNSLPQVDPDADYTAFTEPGISQYPGWQYLPQPGAVGHPIRRILWEQFAQPAAIRKAHLDLVHAPVYAAPLGSRCPFVVTLHDMVPFVYPEMLRPAKRAYLRRIVALSARRSAAVICISESTRRDVLRILGISPDKVHVVPVGVEPAMKPLPRAEVDAFRVKRGLPEEYLLYVGTLEPRKNIPLLLRAYYVLLQAGRALPPLLVGGGKGWYYSAIEELISDLALGDHVRLVGYIPQEELALWYNGAKVFIFPSLYEGFGIPPLEAMACGVPVITSNTSALPEVVEDAGMMVDAHSPDELAVALDHVLRDPQLHRSMAQRGLERAAHFSWEQSARQTAAVYRAALDAR